MIISQQAPLIKKAVTAPKATFEHALEFEGVGPSKPFLAAVSELARSFDSSLSRSALKASQVWVMDQLNEEAAPMRLSELERTRLEKAAGLPMEELGEWELDTSYLDDHGCAFLSKRGAEDPRPSLGDLLQSMTASKH